jgi:hypothetical protein
LPLKAVIVIPVHSSPFKKEIDEAAGTTSKLKTQNLFAGITMAVDQ